MDSSRWQTKNGMLKDDMVENIPERLGKGQDHVGGS